MPDGSGSGKSFDAFAEAKAHGVTPPSLCKSQSFALQPNRHYQSDSGHNQRTEKSDETEPFEPHTVSHSWAHRLATSEKRSVERDRYSRCIRCCSLLPLIVRVRIVAFVSSLRASFALVG
jgi:hypothetical protein